LKRKLDVNLKNLIAGLIVFTIVIGFGTEVFAADQYKDVIVAQNDDTEPPGRGKHRGPPPEAIDVCEGLAEGDGCAFVSPKGDNVGGTCEMTRSDIIACVPEGGPPHGKGKPDGPTPDEGSYN
jgi:hypothetical protein